MPSLEGKLYDFKTTYIFRFGKIVHPNIQEFSEVLFFSGGSTFPYQVWLRVWMYVKNKKLLRILFFWTYMLFRHFTFKYGINVNTKMTIGPGLCIVHGYGIFL